MNTILCIGDKYVPVPPLLLPSWNTANTIIANRNKSANKKTRISNLKSKLPLALWILKNLRYNSMSFALVSMATATKILSSSHSLKSNNLPQKISLVKK